MAGSNEESKQAVLEPQVPREPFPEEVEDRSKAGKAKSYFRTHPVAKWLFLFFFILAVAAGAYVWHYYSVRESTDDAQIDGYIYPVSARVTGSAVAVNVDENDFVRKGEVLVQLDPQDYQVTVERTQADLADAVANAQAATTGLPITSTTSTSGVETARANLNAAQKEVDSALARVREAQANYIKTASDLKRFHLLVEKDEISQQQYDAAVEAEAAAKATLDAAQSQVATAESHVAQARANLNAALTAPEQIRVTQAKAGAAQATVQVRKAALDQARLNLGYTTIKAPVDGIVVKRNVEIGQTVQIGQPVISISDVDDVWVTANYKETQLRDMKVGQKAYFHVDAYNNDLTGHVDSIGGATGAKSSLLPPENATGNFVKVVQRVPVKIVFDKNQDPDRRLRPGMSVDATVLTNSK